MHEVKIFSGNSNPVLANKIANRLQIPLGRATVDRFSDGEIRAQIDENVRGRDAFILQSTSAPQNDNLMELILLGDALRRASAASMTAVIPYFGYARQDRRPNSARVAISAKVVADMLAVVGYNRVITVDLHADQIQGFFDMPVDNVYSTPAMLEDMVKKQLTNLTVVSPDIGGVVRARAVAKKLNDADLAIIDKRRPCHNQAEVMHIIGEVANRNCIIVDDMVDTAGTLTHAASALKDHGAKTVTAYCTHPIFSGAAIENIMNSAIDEVVVGNTIPLTDKARSCPKVRQIDLSHLIAETIYRVNHKESVSSLFVDRV